MTNHIQSSSFPAPGFCEFWDISIWVCYSFGNSVYLLETGRIFFFLLLAARFLVTTRNGKCSNSPQFAQVCFCSIDCSHYGSCKVGGDYLTVVFFCISMRALNAFHLLISFCISSWEKYLFKSFGLFFHFCCLLVELQGFTYCANIPSACM